MSDVVVQQIAALLHVHSPVPHGRYVRCSYPCPWQYGTTEDHALHVAEQVATRLAEQHEE